MIFQTRLNWKNKQIRLFFVFNQKIREITEYHRKLWSVMSPLNSNTNKIATKPTRKTIDFFEFASNLLNFFTEKVFLSNKGGGSKTLPLKISNCCLFLDGRNAGCLFFLGGGLLIFGIRFFLFSLILQRKNGYFFGGIFVYERRKVWFWNEAKSSFLKEWNRLICSVPFCVNVSPLQYIVEVCGKVQYLFIYLCIFINCGITM